MNEKTEYKGYFYSIEQDENAMNPRESDDYLMGTMVCFHRRYDLGDKHDLKSENFSGWAEIKTYLEKELGANIIIPLYLLDHSGLWMRAGRNFSDVDSGGWDSGVVGFIYTTPKRVRELYAVKHITKEKLAKAEAELYREVETYNDYLTGNVYGYVVYDKNGDTTDSCWGYYGNEGYKEAEKEAENIIDYQAEQDSKERAEKTLQEVGC